ncbi:hypothetical protein A3710_17430 [Stutzerimonas frequens]|uniref:hypothetical protein n=1 Tax=Stutzerimonas frequens TaxID=2968969 RepID=UPI0007B87DF4|nr:hypothetical protein [Stutzerimonas frequens]KZX63223.1 hypothetical protein A3710_17430 [Stutzerimonas frequens]
MSKVLVDRELLEYLADLGDEAIERMGSYLAEKHGEQKYVDAARAILAQPAEAEGADVRKIVVDSLVGMIAGVTRMIPPADQPLPDFIQAPVDRAVERINAALSAVTAERDRLLQEKGDPAGSFEKCMQAMRDRDEHARTIDRLRAEVERLRRQLQTAHSFIESTEAFGSAAASGILECAGAVWNIDESKALIAAMAAKEA